MARTKHGDAATTQAIELALKRAGITPGPTPPDQALDNLAVCQMFGVSKGTLKRWREISDFPRPDFVIGLREFVWHSRIIAWTKTRAVPHPLAGKRVSASEAA